MTSALLEKVIQFFFASTIFIPINTFLYILIEIRLHYAAICTGLTSTYL